MAHIVLWERPKPQPLPDPAPAIVEDEDLYDDDCLDHLFDEVDDGYEPFGFDAEDLDQDFDEDVCQLCGRYYAHPHHKEQAWVRQYPGQILPQRYVRCWDV